MLHVPLEITELGETSKVVTHRITQRLGQMRQSRTYFVTSHNHMLLDVAACCRWTRPQQLFADSNSSSLARRGRM